VKLFCSAILLVGIAISGCAFEDDPDATGAAGTVGGAGTTGVAGTNGVAGTTGVAGTNGVAGTTGAAGTAGTFGPGGDMPTLLSQTGLFADIAKDSQNGLAPGVYAFEPTYKLWSDSAAKRRWVYMPPGGKIDTSIMEYWTYPVGFKLWKEFTRDGVRIETRLIMKKGQGMADWYMVAFKWNADGKDAVAVPLGEKNAMGTQHDIPTKENCTTCHGPNAMADTALGFSALQLSHDVTAANELNLQKVKAMGWLTNPPATDKFVLPGNAAESAALGYLHANCGNCHNDYGKVYQTSADLDLWAHLDAERLSAVGKSAAYLSMVCDQWPGPNGKADKFAPITECGAGHATGAHIEGSISKFTKRILPKTPLMSGVRELMSLRGDANSMSQMPPIGSEITDPMGLQILDTWINALP
jgi:hypothetical protein